MGQRDITSYETSMKRKSGIRTASMCRLDVDSAVKEVEQTGDVLSSSRYMLGRGVKRKLSECEDPALGLPYPQQRQLVLDLCLDKLQSCHRRAEPSLHRSVLLANTLRQIQQEMSQEGGAYLPSAPPAPSLAPHAPPTPRHSPDLPPVPLDFPSAPPAWPSPPGAGEDPQAARLGRADTADSLFGAFEITNSTSYLTDLPLDDIFEDIDTSMYDSSDFSALALPSGRGGAGEDPLKTFSTCGSGSTLQLCLTTDLNELDHIMEILVRS